MGREAISVLSGKGPSDVIELIVAECAQMLLLGGKVDTFKDGLEMAQMNLNNGKALAKFKEMISSQGGDCKYIEDPKSYPEAKFTLEIKAERDGYISEINPTEIGWSSVMLGAGRHKVEDKIDYTAGIVFNKKRGDKVTIGEVIATVYTEREDFIAAIDRIRKAITISRVPVRLNPLISHIVTKDYVKNWDYYLKENKCYARQKNIIQNMTSSKL